MRGEPVHQGPPADFRPFPCRIYYAGILLAFCVATAHSNADDPNSTSVPVGLALEKRVAEISSSIESIVNDKQRLAQTRQFLQRLRDFHPTHVGILTLGCSLASASGDYNTVKSYAQTALMLQPNDPVLSLHLANAMLQHREFAASEHILDTLVRARGVEEHLRRKATEMLQREFPEALIRAGIDILNRTIHYPSAKVKVDAITALPYFHAAAVRYPQVYQPIAEQVLMQQTPIYIW